MTTCATCMFHKPTGTPEQTLTRGECRRRAPVDGFPSVHASDWCGEAVARPANDDAPIGHAA